MIRPELMSSENQSTPAQHPILKIIRAIELVLFFLHLVGLFIVSLIHLFLPTKLFLGFIGLYNHLERDYWFFIDNMTEGAGIYAPLWMALNDDFLWILQSYIPVLLPLVIIHHYVEKSEEKESLIRRVLGFFLQALLAGILTIILGGILGTILFALIFVFAFGFTSPEISVNIGEVLDFSASGIVFFDLLFSSFLIGLGLGVEISSIKKWLVGLLISSGVTMFALDKIISVEVHLAGEEAEITAYGYHWLEYVYQKEGVLGLHPLIVQRTENQRIAHEDFLTTLACETGGVDCGTYSFPNISINFIDEAGTLYKGMDGFFHDRPSEVWLEGSTVQVRYQLARKDIPENKKENITLPHQKWAKLPDIEKRNAEKLLIRPISKIQDWGIQIICSSEAEEGYSIVILAQEKELSFHRLEGETLSQRLFFADIEGISELMVVNNGWTSLFVDKEPLYQLSECTAEHYAPVSW